MKELQKELIELFENAPRLGSEKDEPEGVRYILISDTLTNVLVERLKKDFYEIEVN